jgi:hypothetical protein
MQKDQCRTAATRGVIDSVAVYGRPIPLGYLSRFANCGGARAGQAKH